MLSCFKLLPISHFGEKLGAILAEKLFGSSLSHCPSYPHCLLGHLESNTVPKILYRQRGVPTIANIMLVCPTIGEVKSDNLFKMVNARPFHCHDTLFPFVISNPWRVTLQ